MSTVYGVLRVLSTEADAGRPLPGHTLPERNLVFPITAPVTSLGHDLHNAIVLFDPSVAGEQACLYYQSGAWTLEHASDTGTLIVEETPIPPHMVAAIFPGQRIQIGAVHLQLLASDLPPSLGARDGGGDPSRSAGTALWQDGPLTWRAPTTLSGRLALGLLFVLFCVAFALVVVSLGTLLTHRAHSGDGWSVVAALLVPLIPAAGTTALIVLIDRYEREPWYLLLCAFLWGAVIAIPPAFFIENSLNLAIAGLPFDLLPRIWADVSQSALFGLNAGLTEEAVKGAGLLVLLYIVRDKFENITDGILYGAIIGAGFAMIENIAYFANSDSSG
nr:PrsW family intramembrane metalloprotease [Ktedonobacterales bacterium]